MKTSTRDMANIVIAVMVTAITGMVSVGGQMVLTKMEKHEAAVGAIVNEIAELKLAIAGRSSTLDVIENSKKIVGIKVELDSIWRTIEATANH